MSQSNVERIVGRLVTDEAFRRRFWENAGRALEELVALHPKWSEPHVSLATLYYRLNRRQEGDREQAIVRELMRDSKASEGAARQPGSGPPTP